MPSISYRQTEIPNEHILELRPPITDRAAELLCRYAVNPTLMIVNNSSGDHTRLRAHSTGEQDIAAAAQRIGQETYPGKSVEITKLGD